MNRFILFGHRILCCMFVVIGLMMGCGVKNVQPPTAVAAPQPIIIEIKEGFQWPDNDLQKRFQQYWTLRKAGDSTGAFEFEAPHVREMVIWGRYDGFCKAVRSDWTSIRVEKINKITEQLIEVDFNMLINPKYGASAEVFYRDSWLLIPGQWYHVLKDPFVTGDGFGRK